MTVRELLTLVKYEDIKKELLLSRPLLNEQVLNRFEEFFKQLRQMTVPDESSYILKINRENFECVNLYNPDQTYVDDVFTYIPSQKYLDAQVDALDLKELNSALIIAGLLIALTFDGTCFLEEEREEKSKYFKTLLD